MNEPDNRRSSYEGTLTKQRDPLDFKAEAEKGLLTGYASKFWVVDSYAEATAPGAFAETIAQRGPQGANRILLRYEHEHTIGRHTQMAEDATGLAIEAKVSDDGQWGTAVRAHLADEVQYGLSIGFRRHSDRTAEDSDPLDFNSAPDWVKTLPRNEIRVLTGLRLMENSVVSFPAVDPALIDSYRSSEPDIPALIAAIKAGNLSAEHLTQLRELLSETPADTSSNSETPVLSEVDTAKRNRAAEYAFLTADLRLRGILGVDA
jgi:HK97 family phage prohead protease